MKILKIKMGSFLNEKANQPIRDKRDIILLLLETMKMIERLEDNEANDNGRVVVCIDKMSRIFYETKDKYFSFIFPFFIEQQEGYCRFYTNFTECELNDRLISLLISIFQQDMVLENSLDKAMDTIIESAEEYEYDDIDLIWKLIVQLWYMEDGYIRYDYDPRHESHDRHPLYHLDINCSSKVTYKIGIRHAIGIDDFRDILDINTDCAYLEFV